MTIQCMSTRRFASDEVKERSNVVHGMAALVRRRYEGANLEGIWDSLYARVQADPQDGAAFFDLSIILRAVGQVEQAAIVQKAAIEASSDFVVRNGNATGLRLLAFVIEGDFMANTPIEFLVERSDTVLHLKYVSLDTTSLDDIPDHDVAFVAIGESESSRPVLEHLERLLEQWRRPIMNNAPQRIMTLTRDGVADLLSEEREVLAPKAVRIDQETLSQLAQGEAQIESVLEAGGFPILLRPVGTHAGQGLAKIDSCDAIKEYLAARQEQAFYLSPYIDYTGRDGLFRKYRIAFINGVAFASHLAISEHWMVHYLNAGMTAHPEWRAEEAAWMRTFDSGFAVKHAAAFDALYRRIGLDYFAIDCGELPDGRLLVFEADVAMIVHALDSSEMFPYKQDAMRKLFNTFERALMRRIDRHQKTPSVVCAHTGKPAIYQRTPDDCLICALAMLTGRSYEEVVAAATAANPQFPIGGPMTHSIMRAVANEFGAVLLSSIYMVWSHPGIVGVISPTTPNGAHVVFWDGEKIIDPGPCDRVDFSYVKRNGLEFTQRARDLNLLIQHEAKLAKSTNLTFNGEPF